MTLEELRQRVNAIIKRTRNQDVVEYDDVDTLICYIDGLEHSMRFIAEQARRSQQQGQILIAIQIEQALGESNKSAPPDPYEHYPQNRPIPHPGTQQDKG